jgi:hypothetical protein
MDEIKVGSLFNGVSNHGLFLKVGYSFLYGFEFF